MKSVVIIICACVALAACSDPDAEVIAAKDVQIKALEDGIAVRDEVITNYETLRGQSEQIVEVQRKIIGYQERSIDAQKRQIARLEDLRLAQQGQVLANCACSDRPSL